jgi:hypothetical protein
MENETIMGRKQQVDVITLVYINNGKVNKQIYRQQGHLISLLRKIRIHRKAQNGYIDAQTAVSFNKPSFIFSGQGR